MERTTISGGALDPEALPKRNGKPVPNEAEAWQQMFDDPAIGARVIKKQDDGGIGRRPRKKRAGKAAPAAAAASRDGLPEGLMYLDVAELEPSPFNPRIDFEEAKLAELAASMKADGQHQNIVVRAAPGKAHLGIYQVLAGERRLRAAKKAKLPRLLCKVVEADDRKAVEIAGEENFRRQQLNAIEEARWFRSMLDQGYTQQQLADREGITQGQVANRLGLLKLPDDWQRAVISHVIPPTHARELVPWVKHPQVLATLAEALKDVFAGKDEVGTVSEFRRAVNGAVDECSRPLSGHFSTNGGKGNTWRHGVVAFKPTARQRERAAKRADKVREATTGAGRSGGKSDAQKAKEARELIARKVCGYRVEWLQQRIAERVRRAADEGDAALPKGAVARLLLYFCVQSDRQRSAEDLPEAIKMAEVGAAGKGRRKSPRFNDRQDAWDVLAGAGPAVLTRVVPAVLAKWLTCPTGTSGYGWGAHLTPQNVEAIADHLGVDLAAEWRLERPFLELHTKAQLAALCREWKLKGVDVSAKRDDVIDSIVANDANGKRPLPCPKSLRNAKPPRRAW